jgi:hypothetical protein
MKEHPLKMIKLDRNMSIIIIIIIIKIKRVNNRTILSHLIDLNFKPKYDKCDRPEMNTIKILQKFHGFLH